MKQIIKFVETNVDGCGTDAEVLISVNTDKRLNYQEIEDTIKNIKSKHWMKIGTPIPWQKKYVKNVFQIMELNGNRKFLLQLNFR